MIVIGAIELPLFLYAGTASAPFITSVARKLKTPGIPRTGLISSSTKEGPIEQFIAILLGKASHGDVMMMLYFALAIAAYLAIFLWYRHEMKKRNQAYFKDGKDVGPELRLPKLDNAAKA